MTRLQESQFSRSADLEEIVTWGSRPMKHLLKLMDAYIEESLDEDDEEIMCFFRYEFEDKINGIEEAIYRAMKELKVKRGEAQESQKSE